LVRGKIDLKVVTRWPGISVNNSTVKPGELSTLQFTSNQTYQVATLANYSTEEDRVVLSLGGLSQDKLPEKPSVYHWISFRFGIGRWTLFFSSGYEMVYTISRKRMSGSPVLDTGGRLIGFTQQQRRLNPK